jgi:hypothetical protein
MLIRIPREMTTTTTVIWLRHQRQSRSVGSSNEKSLWYGPVPVALNLIQVKGFVACVGQGNIGNVWRKDVGMI